MYVLLEYLSRALYKKCMGFNYPNYSLIQHFYHCLRHIGIQIIEGPLFVILCKIQYEINQINYYAGMEERCNCGPTEMCVSSGGFGRLECEEGKNIYAYLPHE